MRSFQPKKNNVYSSGSAIEVPLQVTSPSARGFELQSSIAGTGFGSHLRRLLNWFFAGWNNQCRASRTSRLPPWALALACLFLLSVAGIYAFSTSYSSFAFYDDEGYMMITVQGFLRGFRLYDQVLTIYGPFYYFYEWLIHAVISLPVTHEVTRGVCMFDWLLAASLLALAGARITRSALLGVFVFIQGVLHLRPLVSEPGHPQELVAVLVALAAFIAPGGLQRKPTLVLLGAIGAASVFTKINVGAFYMFALGLALSCYAPFFQAHPVRFCALLALTSLVPFALMRPHLSQGWARFYAAHECAAILTAGAVAYTLSDGSIVRRARALQAVGAFVVVSGTLVLVLILTGSSMSAMVENLVTAPTRLGSLVCSPFRVFHCLSWSIAAFLSAACAVLLRSHSDRFRLIIAGAKGVFGWLGAMQFLLNYTQAFGCLLPWSWLVIVPVGPRASSTNSQSFARSFLCLMAVWQGLQAYPAAGTQRALATFLLVLIYAVCLYDAFSALVAEPWVVRHVGTLDPRTPVLIEALVLATLLCLSFNWCNPSAAWRRYNSIPLLGFRGTGHLRVNLPPTSSYRELTEYIETNSDAFITLPGLNSLYFWTGKNPPVYFINGSIVWMTHSQQSRLITILQKSSHPMIVLTDPPPKTGAPITGVAYAYPDGPLSHAIRDQYHEIKRIGSFRILALRDEPENAKPGPKVN